VTGAEGVAGDMPRDSQFGYLFKGATPQTIAHEIGHGVCHLDHPFDRANGAKSFSESDLADNLMQYHNGTNLVKLQWDAVHAPGLVIGVFETDKRGMFVPKSGEYIGFSLDGHVVTKQDGYKTILLSPDSRFIQGFIDENKNEYKWTNGKYVGKTEFTNWTVETNVSGKVAVWRYDNQSDCFRLYKYVQVKDYTSSDFNSQAIQDSINSTAGNWLAEYNIADQTAIQRAECEKLVQQAIDALNKSTCIKNYVSDNPGSIAFYANRNQSCLSELTQEERISMLQVLVEHVKGAGFGGDYDIDNAICRILYSIPTIEEKTTVYTELKIRKIANDQTLFNTIVNDMSDDALVVFSKWLTEYIYEKKLYTAENIDKNTNLHSFLYQTKKDVETSSILTREAVAFDLEVEKSNGQITIQPIRIMYSGGVALTTRDGEVKLESVTVPADEMVVVHFHSNLKYGLETIYQENATIAIPALALWAMMEEKSERDLSLGIKAAAMIITLPTALEGGWAAAFTLIDELALGSSILIDDTGWRATITSSEGKAWLQAYDLFVAAYFTGRALDAVGTFNDLKLSYGNWQKVSVEAKETETITARMSKIVKVEERTKTGESLQKLRNKASSENIAWTNLNETNLIWVNSNNTVLSTAKTFASEIGSSLYDAVLSNGFYIKFDINDGRILFGETNGIYHAFAVVSDDVLNSFKTSVLTASDDVFNTKLFQLLSSSADKLKGLSGGVSKSLTIAGKTTTLSTSKVNTILGKFNPELRQIFDELGSFKNVGLGEAKGGVNLLNKPDHYYDVSNWWNAYNKPWLDRAIARGDDIYLATIPTKADVIENGNLLGAYAEELNYLVSRNYKPINITDLEWNNIKNWLKK
jgi:hypothetical protein